MKRALFVFLALLSLTPVSRAQVISDLPSGIYAEGGKSHVQGIALDKEKGRMYFSFTTSFVKTDLQGKVLGSLDRIQGHLGAMTFNPVDRKVYASLECKDDEIGSGLSSFAKGRSMFYIAIIDVDRIDSSGIDSEDNDIFKIVCIKEAGADYHSTQMISGKPVEHRYGCSGIDGVTIGPKFGKIGGKNFLYVAYGIYGDNSREDNNCQVLLRYDLGKLWKYARTVKFGDFYGGGPDKPLDKYFIYTGNTTWGVQNLAYDPFSGKLFMAVYKGKKEAFHNYGMFVLDMKTKPQKRILEEVPYDSSRHLVIGSRNEPVSGIDFDYGSTGLAPAGNGLFYISQNGKDKDSGKQFCHALLYRWTGDNGFILSSSR